MAALAAFTPCFWKRSSVSLLLPAPTHPLRRAFFVRDVTVGHNTGASDSANVMIVYIHGFNSSPASHKSNQLRERLAALGRSAEFVCPELPHWPKQAMAALEREIGRVPAEEVTLVGSSLGGFYATVLTEQTGVRSVLVNPAITPQEGLRTYLGPQKNLHTGEPYELTEAHLREWEKLYAPRVTPGRYLLIVETDDEVLDYRRAVARYAGAEQRIVPGGDHSLQSFPEHLARILEFARAAAL